MEWYPQNSEKLNKVLEEYLSQKTKQKPREIHGLIVPHAGYEFSGEIGGKAFSFLKPQNSKNFGSRKSEKKQKYFLGDKKFEKAVILAPSHYAYFKGVASLEKIETPLGKIEIIENKFPKIKYEHAIDNQVPFLQKLGVKKILPLVIGEILKEQAEKIAESLAKKISNSPLIISTDLSHFFPYNEAVKKDKQTIKIIENLDLENFDKIDACGKYPLLILMHLCRLKNYKPELIEYKNSGDVTGEKNQVVGYASFSF